MRLRVTNWIATALHLRRVVTPVVPLDAPPPAGPPLDHERVLQVGDALQSCYPERDEMLDGNLTALMLHLTVEPAEPIVPPALRKR